MASIRIENIILEIGPRVIQRTEMTARRTVLIVVHNLRLLLWHHARMWRRRVLAINGVEHNLGQCGALSEQIRQERVGDTGRATGARRHDCRWLRGARRGRRQWGDDWHGHGKLGRLQLLE